MSRCWTCEDCVKENTDACYFQNVVDGYKYCQNMIVDINYAYQQGRADAIDDCIKLVGGNVKTIVGVVFDSSIPEWNRALGRTAQNKLIEDLIIQLEQLKEQKDE